MVETAAGTANVLRNKRWLAVCRPLGLPGRHVRAYYGLDLWWDRDGAVIAPLAMYPQGEAALGHDRGQVRLGVSALELARLALAH